MRFGRFEGGEIRGEPGPGNQTPTQSAIKQQDKEDPPTTTTQMQNQTTEIPWWFLCQNYVNNVGIIGVCEGVNVRRILLVVSVSETESIVKCC